LFQKLGGNIFQFLLIIKTTFLIIICIDPLNLADMLSQMLEQRNFLLDFLLKLHLDFPLVIRAFTERELGTRIDQVQKGKGIELDLNRTHIHILHHFHVGGVEEVGFFVVVGQGTYLVLVVVLLEGVQGLPRLGIPKLYLFVV
jgi:hypothetical protein